MAQGSTTSPSPHYATVIIRRISRESASPQLHAEHPKKEGRVTCFLGADNFFKQAESDQCRQRFALATLIGLGPGRASAVESSRLGIPYRTLMNWARPLAEKGAGSFYVPRAPRGSTGMTEKKARKCERRLAAGGTISEVAGKMDVKDAPLRKAVSRRGLIQDPEPTGQDPSKATTKSQRSGAQAAGGMGAAWARPDERMAAAPELVESAATRFEPCEDVAMGGLLVGLVEYGREVLPGTLPGINPARRLPDKGIREDKDLCLQRRNTPKKVTIDSWPEAERPTQLPSMAKILTATVKMIAYRSGTALVGLLRKPLKKEEEARALARELFVSAAHLLPKENTLTVRVHRMASPAHDKEIAARLSDLTNSAFLHPQTGAQLIYKLILKRMGQLIFLKDQDV